MLVYIVILKSEIVSCCKSHCKSHMSPHAPVPYGHKHNQSIRSVPEHSNISLLRISIEMAAFLVLFSTDKAAISIEIRCLEIKLW